LATKLAADPTGKRLLSYSQIADFSRCRYRWHLYAKRRIRSRIDRPPLGVGSGVHVALATGILHAGSEMAAEVVIDEWYQERIQRVGRELTEDESVRMEEIRRDVTAIGSRAIRSLNLNRYRTACLPGTDIPMVELNLVVPLPGVPGYDGFRFYCDWVPDDEALGIRWLVDHKVREQFSDDEAEEVNLQAALYQAALRRFGVVTNGTATHQIRRKIPAIPKRNKDGSMSRAYIASDWSTYRAALRRAGLDPADYREEMEPKLAKYEWQRWTRAYRSEVELDALWNTVVMRAGRAMSRKRLDPWRNMNLMECAGCWARQFCLAELRDDDTNYLLATGYMDRDVGSPGLVVEMDDGEQEETP
jgi:hypothetical protein